MAEEKLEHCGLPLVEQEARQVSVSKVGYFQRPYRFVEARGACAKCGQRFVWVIEGKESAAWQG